MLYKADFCLKLLVFCRNLTLESADLRKLASINSTLPVVTIMIIEEVPSDLPTTSNPYPRLFFADQPPPPAPRIVEEAPNNAARKTLAELFASYANSEQTNQSSADTTIHPPSHNSSVFTYPHLSQESINNNTTNYSPQNAPTSSYNPAQHIGPLPRLWFPPRPPGQDIDGNSHIPDNPWTPVPLSATMEDALCTPGPPTSNSVSMPDHPWTPPLKPPISRSLPSKFAFFALNTSLTANISSQSITFPFHQEEGQPPRRKSEASPFFTHACREPPTRNFFATTPALPDQASQPPKYVNPFLPRSITLPASIPIPPKSSPENISPRTPTAPVPHVPKSDPTKANAPFTQLNNHPFVIPPTVHVLENWPYGPLLDNISPRTRHFAIGDTDADGNDTEIYRPRLSRDAYLECLPPSTRVEIRCTSRACGLVCDLDGRAEACRRRSATADDAARWRLEMWECKGCGDEMQLQVFKLSEDNSPTDTGNTCCKKDEQDG
ncbi:hypothetical protein O988_01269 [Pseudogymnoascus sp. VKM F-3808]|nr:hypothetical protein O988_01269 [Pseudogymnoascus sp. VKM F-3808]